MSLVKLITDAVNQARVQLGDLIVATQLRRVAGTYDKSTSKVIQTEKISTVNIAIIKFEFKEIDGTLVRTDDLKGLIFDTDQDVQDSDKLMFNGVEYEIIKTTPTYAGSTLVLLEVQLRK